MNTNNQIIEFFENNQIIEFDENIATDNAEIVENPENNHLNQPVVLNLGPPPILQRNNPPVYFGEDAEELLADREFQGYDTPDDFVMPVPCSRCYWAQCNGTCEIDTPFIQAIRAQQLAFEEEMDLPPPPVLTKNTHVYLMDEEWRLPSSIPPPLTRSYTNAHLFNDEELLVALSEAALFEQLEDKEEDADESDEFDMPEGIQYVSLSIINEAKDEDEDEDQDQDQEQDR